MTGEYKVYCDGMAAGSAVVSRSGLYYIIQARCDLPQNVHRLLAIWQDKSLDLGIFVPSKEGFRLKKSIVCKYTGQGSLRFEAVAMDNRKPQRVRAETDAPFPYLTCLQKMCLVVQESGNELQING